MCWTDAFLSFFSGNERLERLMILVEVGACGGIFEILTVQYRSVERIFESLYGIFFTVPERDSSNKVYGCQLQHTRNIACLRRQLIH
jgi:hypothetical protein